MTHAIDRSKVSRVTQRHHLMTLNLTLTLNLNLTLTLTLNLNLKCERVRVHTEIRAQKQRAVSRQCFRLWLPPELPHRRAWRLALLGGTCCCS